MRAALEIFLHWTFAVAVCGLALLCAVAAISVLGWRMVAALRRLCCIPVAEAVLVVGAVAAILYAGTKPPSPVTGRFLFDQYLRDAGSYLTNDVAHVAAVKQSPLIPDTTPVRVYAQELGHDPAAEWVELSPPITYGDLPADYSLPNATNHNVMVSLDWVPPSPVITNIAFSAASKIVIRELHVSNGVIRIVVPRSKLVNERNQ